MLTNALALEAQSARMAVFMVVLQCEVAIYRHKVADEDLVERRVVDDERARPSQATSTRSNLGLVKFPFGLPRASGRRTSASLRTAVVGFAA